CRGPDLRESGPDLLASPHSVRGRQDDRVDHVDHAVAGFEVGDRHGGGAVDHDVAVDDLHGDGGAVHGLDRGRATTGGNRGQDVTGHQLAGDDVVGQDAGEVGAGQKLFGGDTERFERSGEGGVGGREDGERPFAGQDAGQVGFDDGRDEGAEVFGAGGDVDDGRGQLVLGLGGAEDEADR